MVRGRKRRSSAADRDAAVEAVVARVSYKVLSDEVAGESMRQTSSSRSGRSRPVPVIEATAKAGIGVSTLRRPSAKRSESAPNLASPTPRSSAGSAGPARPACGADRGQRREEALPGGADRRSSGTITGDPLDLCAAAHRHGDRTLWARSLDLPGKNPPRGDHDGAVQDGDNEFTAGNSFPHSPGGNATARR